MNRDRVAISPGATDRRTVDSIVRRALRRGFTIFIGPEAAVPGAPAGIEVWRQEADLFSPPPGKELRPVPIVAVGDAGELERAQSVGQASGAVAIRWTSERVVPLENLLAAAHGRFAVWVIVERLRDVPGTLAALERGADRIVVAVDSLEQLDELESALEDLGSFTIPWELVQVRRVAPAGVGDRVIVDTTSLLRPAEGLLVGSAAAFLVHVASEAEGSRFTRPRPFRVNAGAAHSYTLLADGSTRYLAELAPGDPVLITEPNGRPRAVRVGRIKIERRPMTVIEIDHAGRSRTLFAQEAETVRLSGEHSRIPVTELAAGARVYGAPLAPARHMGTAVEETIDER